MTILYLLSSLAWWVCVAQAQPIQCSEDSQCARGYFCLADAHQCRECMRCDQLQRQPPTAAFLCVRSVAECGACLKGYVEDRLGVGEGCVEPESAGGAVWYVWVLGALLVTSLLVCAAVVLVYALRNTDSFRVLASTRTSVEAPVVGKPVEASAPQPPPYNYSAPYAPVRPGEPDHPPPPPPQTYAQGDYYRPSSESDPAAPLVKAAGGAGGAAGGAAREAAGSQRARVYSNPAYVRNVPPPSYDSAFSDDSDHEPTPFEPQDEDTMPSAWTPQTEPAEEEAGASGAVARRPARGQLVSPPPAKVRCVEDSNNNNNAGSHGGAPPTTPPAAPAPAPAAPSVVINVLNVNAMHQRNDVTL